ncbi:MAG: GTP 3',8-cyclase MoaA [Acidimicrobiia bacterium]|nr:GTP 3',8-cyclase MoaA [Acidimicrobiia bacterium]
MINLTNGSDMVSHQDPVRDTRGRALHDLRISVTDRCNFRCTYCMPASIFGKDYEYLARDQLLSFEEITRVARAFVGLGVSKIRLTGGEPLLRKGIEDLIGMLAEIPGVDDLTVTTNASLLSRRAERLSAAGLDRVTVSLDSLDDEVFRRMNDVDFPVVDVLEGIEAAESVGLTPIKINCVVIRGVNDHTVVPMAEHFRESGHIVRFIEYMDVGTTNGWRLDDVVPAREIVSLIDTVHPVEPIEPNYVGEVANRYRYADGSGEFGVIASVTQPFCDNCSRVRLSAEGSIYTCLFASQGTDLRQDIRDGSSDAELTELVRGVWSGRTDAYSEHRSNVTFKKRKVEMSYIGG